MDFDTKKINPTPKDKWEAIDLMNKAQQKLLEALHIMESMLENNSSDFKEVHEKRMKNFVNEFTAT